MSYTKKRLSKILASSGVASRRKAEELIQAGKVRVNGEQVTIPQTLVDPTCDTIVVDGKKVTIQEKVYYMLHKPVGYTCTHAAVKKRVVDLFPDGKRLFTVGRLDKDTSGLLLVTNDGHFAQAIIHPSKGIDKEYVVKVDKEVCHEHLVTISEGTRVEGIFVKPVRVTKVRRATLKVVVGEGKKHEVRALVEKAGLTVKELKRIRIGPLVLGTLPYGTFRSLSPKEIDAFVSNE